MSEEGPKLNGPDRYRKSSPRLVLEEHSHCEVPAGCGGVVLRWIHADREVPIHVRLYTLVEGAKLTIDGAAPASTRPLLSRGDHVLAIHLRAERAKAALMCSLRFDDSDYDRRVSRKIGLVFRCDTAADGTWLATTTPPLDSRWRDDPFDDSAWTPMVALDLPTPARNDPRGWYYRNLVDDVAAIGLPDTEGDLWIRKRFRIPLVGEEGGGT